MTKTMLNPTRGLFLNTRKVKYMQQSQIMSPMLNNKKGVRAMHAFVNKEREPASRPP